MAGARPTWKHINDRKTQLEFAFQGARILDRIVGWNLDAGPVHGERNHRNLYPFLMAQSIGDAIYNKKETDLGYIMSLGVANCTAPCVQEKALNQQEARAMFKRNALSFIHTSITKPRAYSSLTEDILATIYVPNAEPVHPHLPDAGIFAQVSAANFVKSEQFDTIVADPTSLNWICHVLAYLAEQSTHPMIKYASTFVYVYTYVAFAKRGTITEAKAMKISEQIRLETDVPLNLEPEIIASIYAALSNLITEVNARDIFTTWANDTIGLSLRMRITLDQVAGSGLTTYSAIREALHLFLDFPWGIVFGYLPKDRTGFSAALEAIGSNEYYGFSQSLNNHGSSKYKSLGYVAKELLVRHGGPEFGSLGRANCWTRNPLHKVELDALIEGYRTGGEVPPAASEELVRDMLRNVARTYEEDISDGENDPEDEDRE